MQELTRAGVLAAALTLGAAGTVAPAPARAQQAATAARSGEGADAVSMDSAAALRRALRRPPGEPPFDAVDAALLPFRVATFPLRLLGDGMAGLIDLAVGPPPPPPWVLAYRDVVAWGVQPSVTDLGPRSGPAVQVRLQRFEPFFLETGMSWRGSQRHRAGVRLAGPSGEVGMSFGFQRQAEPRFWGLGPDSREADRASFLWDRTGIEAALAWNATGRLRLSGEVGYEDNRVDEGWDGASPDLGEVFDPASLFGAGQRTRFVRVGVSARLDLTRRRGFQTRGGALRVGTTAYRGARSTAADFHRLHADARGYVPLNPRQLLLVRAAGELNRADDGPGVPFTHMATLGDEYGARGYPEGRFRHRDRLALTAEWRYEVWRELQERTRMEGMVFVDQGTVARRLDELDSSDWRFSFGAGLRLVTARGTVATGYVAAGEDGPRVEVGVGAAF